MTVLLVFAVMIACGLAGWWQASKDLDRRETEALRHFGEQQRERQIERFIDEQHALGQEDDLRFSEREWRAS